MKIGRRIFFGGILSGSSEIHTRGDSEGGGNGGEDGDGDVQDFLPEFVLVHNLS